MSGPLTAALRPLGLVPLSWSHLRTHHRPGAGISALYRVAGVPRRSSADSPRQPVQLQVGATTAVLTPEQGRRTVRGSVDGTAVRLWVHPRDPVLPSLAWATNPDAVARDLFAAGTDGARASLTLAAYRPLRRAVIRCTFEESTAYLKVLQSGQVPGLRRRLEAAAAAGLPVPPLLDITSGAVPEPDSILALGALPGRSLHQHLHAFPAGIEPQALLELLAGLPAAALSLPRKPAWADRVMDYAAGAVVALPQEAERIARCAAETHAAVCAADPGPLVPAHGDFHGGNLLVDDSPVDNLLLGNLLPDKGRTGWKISGMLDVDALGPGHLVDDLACFAGHLYVFAAVNPRRAGLLTAAERFAAAFAAATDPGALYSRAAAVALTLVAGAAGRGPGAAERTLSTAEELLVRSRDR
ncbi:phosphotransferase [Arthrobacter gengyunqii]|uniref:Aminoglycoside phosphotransferase family protein n=1 Tax=Arthrobacter gengyunqii TaxID=2886940 RepID=A0ABS8GKV2_9MICC|nr:phosphotransferase [Arthrobacter gengyunqii]MCC3267307.1 aminoglycoside phosphotransferase family protein [Arthrobacter gengyunqii]